jgi:benzoyl-CoA reductase/2-hydroxyglutaryl-CoA dehydratase subunit BcrC/BadD/HgdB
MCSAIEKEREAVPELMFDGNYLAGIEEEVFRQATDRIEAGCLVVGVYCAFTPKELIAAAGAIPVSLCASSESAIPYAEAHLPRNLCPLIKSSYGFALTDTCPYFHDVDFVLADATCDGKKKMFELLGRIKPVHLLQLPQTADTLEAFRYWLNELRTVKILLEEGTGSPITEASIKEQIRLYNEFRRTAEEVFAFNRGDVTLLYGREICAITNPGGFECNLSWRMAEMRLAMERVRKRASNAEFRRKMGVKPRILLTGCPTTNKKVLNAIEENGGIVAAMENCGGLKTLGMMVREDMDPLEALAERYLSVACPCMTPNTKRLDLIGQIIEDYHIDGVVELTWQACHTYNIEACRVREFVTNQCGRNYLQIETDYSEADAHRIKLRIDAFLELLNG